MEGMLFRCLLCGTSPFPVESWIAVAPSSVCSRLWSERGNVIALCWWNSRVCLAVKQRAGSRNNDGGRGYLTLKFPSRCVSSCIHQFSIRLIILAAPFSTRNSAGGGGATIEAVEPIPLEFSPRARNTAKQMKSHLH